MALFNPFTGILGQDSATPSIYDVQRRQALGQRLSGTPYIENSGPIGALAQTLGGTLGGYENSAAANEAQQGQTQAIQALGKALSNGYQGVNADPAAYATAMGSGFLPQGASTAAGDWYQNQVRLNTPQYVTGGYSGAPPGIFTPGAPSGEQFKPLQETQSSWDSVADGIEGGMLAPNALNGLSKAGQQYVLSRFNKDGFNQADAALNFKGAETQMGTQNNVSNTRFRSAVQTAGTSLDIIDKLADQWQALKAGSGQTDFPDLNAANLALAQKGAFGQQAASLATQIAGQINDSSSEIGQIFAGGKSPTDHALQLGATQLNQNWSTATIHDMTNLLRQNMMKRLSAMESTSTGVGVGGNGNTYLGPAPNTDIKMYTPPNANAPAVGTVDSGYRFKGGDPSDQNNWEKVQ